MTKVIHAISASSKSTISLNFNDYAQPIIQELNLTKSGKQYEGPCPLCGGQDRFRISNRNGELKHHCRNECDLKDRTHALRNMGLLPEIKVGFTMPYHQQKNIPLIAASLEGNDVIIPISNVISGEQIGRQTIKPNGKKLFNKGMRKDGAGAFIGKPSDKLYVCEGWATAVAVHKATGQQALFALDAKTLVKTVKLIDHPDVVIAADNDAEGISAAKATGLPWIAPESAGEDWWDAWSRGGSDLVQSQLRQIHDPVSKSHDFNFDRFSFLTASELLAQEYEPLQFLYEEIIPTPNLVLLAGPPKIGKSWYAMHIMQEVRKNGHRVVLLANEDSNRRLQNRYKKIAPFDDNGVFFFGGLSNQTAIPKGKMAHDFIRAIAAKYGPKMIIIDTVQAIRSTDKNENYASAEEEFSALRHLAHELNIVIICVHHTKKMPDYKVTPIESILGSQGIAATVETILVMQEMSNTKDANLYVTGKDVEPAELVLQWCYPGYSDPELATLASLGSAQTEVLDFIKSHPRCTQAAIVTNTNKTKGQVSEIVGKLVKRDLIRRTDQGTYICTV